MAYVTIRFSGGSSAEAGGYSFNARYLLPPETFIASGGGVPLMLREGTLVGTASVSGLPDEEDLRLVVNVLRELRK